MMKCCISMEKTDFVYTLVSAYEVNQAAKEDGGIL